MKSQKCFLVVALVFCFAHSSPAPIVGYFNTAFTIGDTLFNNTLDNGTNTLSTLFSRVAISNGTTVSLWNAATSSFDTTSTFSSGAWSLNLTLSPGTGARLNTSVAFTNTFVGEVQNHDGSILTDDQDLAPPPVFSGFNGIYLLGDKCVTSDTGTDIFLNVLGRLPNTGEQVTLLNNVSEIYTTSTYLGNGNWDNVPMLGVGQAAFFNIQSVPEPSVSSLLSICFLYFCWRMKRPNNSPEPPLIAVSVPHSWLTDLAARLSFCRCSIARL
jgi:hypothetical protein